MEQLAGAAPSLSTKPESPLRQREHALPCLHHLLLLLESLLPQRYILQGGKAIEMVRYDAMLMDQD